MGVAWPVADAAYDLDQRDLILFSYLLTCNMMNHVSTMRLQPSSAKMRVIANACNTALISRKPWP